MQGHEVLQNPAAYTVPQKILSRMDKEERSTALYFHPLHAVNDGQNLNNVEQPNYPTEHVVD